MAWQVTVFLTTLFIAIAFLLVRFVVRSRKQEEELEKARARPDADEEVRVVLHELKNAMTLTDNVAQVIQDKGFNEKRFRMMLDGLGRFSEIARIAGERSGGKRTQLASVVDEALQLARSYEDVEVEFIGAEGDVLASPLLKNALQNLFKNSVEAMEGCEEKRLTVVLESRDNRLILVVKDTGCGMSDAVKERMWERGYTTKETGDGIGMKVIRDGIESSDGKVLFVESKEGEGTQFLIAFRRRGELDSYEGD